MQFLEKTSKSYQVVLLALEATNKLAWESNWEIHSPGSPSGPSDQPTSLGGLTAGTVAVTVVPGPLNATQQIRVRSFQLSNLDTGAATVLWQKTDSATAVTRTLMQVVLQTLESMVYDENGWTFYDSSGNIKTTNTAAANNAQSVAVSGGIVASTAQSVAVSVGPASSTAASAGLTNSVSASNATSAGLGASTASSVATSGGLAVSMATSAGLATSVAQSDATSAGLAASVAQSVGQSFG